MVWMYMAVTLAWWWFMYCFGMLYLCYLDKFGKIGGPLLGGMRYHSRATARQLIDYILHRSWCFVKNFDLLESFVNIWVGC